MNDKRIDLEKEFMQPFASFKSIIADTCKLITECSGKIDLIVKQSEQNEKSKKRAIIEKLWDSEAFDLVQLSKVFDDKWLNKGVSFKTIKADIKRKIESIKDDILTIEAIGEDVDLLKSIYIDTLNLNATVQYARKLKEKQREGTSRS